MFAWNVTLLSSYWWNAHILFICKTRLSLSILLLLAWHPFRVWNWKPAHWEGGVDRFLDLIHHTQVCKSIQNGTWVSFEIWGFSFCLLRYSLLSNKKSLQNAMLNVKNKLKPVNPYMYWYMGGRPPLEPPESGLACPCRQMRSSPCSVSQGRYWWNWGAGGSSNFGQF